MRWLIYGPEDQDRMWEDLTALPLQELYERHSCIEKHLEELRKNEPSPKRKNEWAHTVWFSQCQGCIADLRKVRDAIYIVKKRGNDIMPDNQGKTSPSVSKDEK